MMRIKEIIITILISNWIEINYNELKKICQRVSKQEEVDDLLHSCILQFLTNKKALEIEEKQRLFFFTKIVSNNFYSKTSKYYHQYKKHNHQEFIDIQIKNVEYEESKINLEWVYIQLNKMSWYYKRLFELYIEQDCNMRKLSKKTSIPVNSISRDINKVRNELKKLRIQEQKIN